MTGIVPEIRDWQRRLEGLLGVPATTGNEVRVLRDGEEIFPAMLRAIARAAHTVDLLTFVYWTGEIAQTFADTLCGRARAGVRCRVILDAVGARHVDTELIQAMEDAGVLLHWFHPLSEVNGVGNRTHRKVLICDEEVAFAGGIGIAEEWDGSSDDGSAWRETQIELRGPVVDGLRAAFVDDWFEASHPLFDETDRFPEQPTVGSTTAIVVRGESESGWNDIAMLRHALLAGAQRRVRITTAYLSPDERVLEALRDASRRGVQLQLLVSGPRIDKEVSRLAAERTYEHLLEAGVEIYEFEPTMLHAKVMTVDGKVGVVGSANLNSRSLRHDEEVDVVLLDEEIVAHLDAQSDADLERCEQVTPGLVAERSPARGVLRRVVAAVDHWA